MFQTAICFWYVYWHQISVLNLRAQRKSIVLILDFSLATDDDDDDDVATYFPPDKKSAFSACEDDDDEDIVSL